MENEKTMEQVEPIEYLKELESNFDFYKHRVKSHKGLLAWQVWSGWFNRRLRAELKGPDLDLDTQARYRYVFSIWTACNALMDHYKRLSIFRSKKKVRALEEHRADLVRHFHLGLKGALRAS